MKPYNQPVDLRTEIIAGVTTFLAMSYLILVNPQILSVTGMDKNAPIAFKLDILGTLKLKVLSEKSKEIKPAMWAITLLSVPFFLI